MLMSAIDTTVVILALPTIVSDLSSSLLLAVWTIIGYLLVVAVFTTQIGSLGDAFGRGKIFAMGFTVFTIGSLLCGLSGTMLELVSFRIVQGFGAAMLQSCSSALIADAFPAAARGKAFGYTTLGWNVGGTLGIVLGGVITTFLGWRFIFFINIPVGILGVYLARVTLRHEPGQIPRLDYPGMAILGSILLLLVYAATQLASAGISNLVLLLIMVALLLLPPFVYVEKRSANPIIRIGPLLSRTLGVPLFTSFLQAAGYLSVVFILILYLQGIRGYTPLYSSLLLVPGYVAASFLAPYMGRLSDRMGPRNCRNCRNSPDHAFGDPLPLSHRQHPGLLHHHGFPFGRNRRIHVLAREQQFHHGWRSHRNIRIRVRTVQDAIQCGNAGQLRTGDLCGCVRNRTGSCIQGFPRFWKRDRRAGSSLPLWN